MSAKNRNRRRQQTTYQYHGFKHPFTLDDGPFRDFIQAEARKNFTKNGGLRPTAIIRHAAELTVLDTEFDAAHAEQDKLAFVAAIHQLGRNADDIAFLADSDIIPDNGPRQPVVLLIHATPQAETVFLANVENGQLGPWQNQGPATGHFAGLFPALRAEHN
ncbi:hypothetical protein AYO44_13290 [Planctomycetaceae bacterium SCGC AG-212-F19]|nr:hypothetical protein AYO44_13290 [Planctomycetaceae bacterium SCGC AG-212-F19]